MSRYLPLALFALFLTSCGPKNEKSTTTSASTSTIGKVATVEKDAMAKEGSLAPNFTWKDEGGAEHSLNDYRGKVVMINFWGTWCPPCRAELPDIVKLREEYAPKGFEVIGVALERNDNMQALRTFAEKNNLRYPIVLADETIPAAYGGISAVPTTFIIDREGKMRNMVMGMQSEAQFRALLSATL